MTNKLYYFTYGSEGYPFKGGWTRVVAPNREGACVIFRMYHPDKYEGILNCAGVYNEEEFQNTKMSQSGNLGAFLHEVLTSRQILIKQEDEDEK